MEITIKFKLLFCALLSGFFCGGVIAGDRNEQNVVHEHAALSARDIEAFEVVEDSRYQIKRDFAQQIGFSIAAFHKISVPGQWTTEYNEKNLVSASLLTQTLDFLQKCNRSDVVEKIDRDNFLYYQIPTVCYRALSYLPKRMHARSSEAYYRDVSLTKVHADFNRAVSNAYKAMAVVEKDIKQAHNR